MLDGGKVCDMKTTGCMKFLEGIEISAEDVNCSAHELFARASQADMLNWVSDFEGKNIHSVFFASRISRAAQGFAGLGLERGERVMVALPKMPHAFSCFYALNLLGATAVYVDPEAGEDDIVRLIDELDCQMVVACDYNKGRFSQAAGRVYPDIPLIVANYGVDQLFPRNALYPILGRKEKTPVSKNVKLIKWDKFMDIAKKAGVIEIAPATGEEAACIVLDGEAGVRSPQLYTNREVNAVARGLGKRISCRFDDDSVYCDAPIHTLEGLLVGVHAAIANQAYILTDVRQGVEEKVAFALRKNAKVVCGTPAFYEELIRNPRFANTNLKHVHAALCSGLAEPTVDEVRAFLGAHNSQAELIALDK